MSSGTAWAQSWDDTRRALIDQATQARDRGELDRALQLARQAEGLRASPSLSLAIAEIEQSMQRPLAALQDARACVRALEADTAARDRARALAVCSTLVSTIEARVGRVTFSVAGAPSNLELRLDGRSVPRESWEGGVEVLAGSVVIDASAPGRRPLHREVTVAPRATERVTVALDAETSVTPVTPVTPVTVTPVTVTPVVGPPTTPASQGPGVGPWIVMGAGVASLALSGVFFGLREGALSDRDARCTGAALRGDDCVVPAAQVQDAQSAQDAAVGFTTAAYVTLGVGAAALAGGVLWRVLGGRRTENVTVSASPTATGAAGTLRISF
ncbi:MAG: hypothetical protein U0326_27080 [Polyangiales bacterium]